MKDTFMSEFQEFWNQAISKVRAYMFCVCQNQSDADDLTQDCCVRALRAWNQFNGKASRQAWLFGIARRTRADWLRNKKRQSLTLDPQVLEQKSKTVSEKSNIDNIDAIWEAVKDLNNEYSEIIHLRFAAGLSYEQIAHTLEIPLGTVRSRLHRGLKVIKENVGDLENES